MGDIGKHRVVSTKLPMAGGQSRDALIATGGTTTRLLGTFQGVEQVFLVGVGGAVPHYTDFKRHVRLGDVVMSAPPLDGQRFIYQYCENVTEKPLPSSKGNSSEIQFETKSWCPVDLCLQEIAHSLVERQRQRNNYIESNDSENLHETVPWLSYYSHALESLETRTNGETAKNEPIGGECNEKSDDGYSNGGCNTSSWRRPSSDSDRLYMSVGNGDVIEVGHPTSKNEDDDPRLRGEPMLHVGPIGAGRRVAFNERLRHDFSSRFHGILAFDCELDSVIESIFGNRKDSYMLIRGIADYKDGTTGSATRGTRGSSGGKDWQQYAALMAAAVLKAVVNEMD